VSTVGHFEIVKEVACTPVVQVSRVKTPQKPDGSLVLKRCAPREDGFIDCKPVIRSFLEAARVQETVAARPDAHWAPVRERGEDENGAYYLTDYYPGSAQKLIVGKLRLSGPGLMTLVRAVLSGLAELKQACDRHHGNLKATNVLIAGTDEVQDRDVFLTDPADSSRPEANDGGADDLFQLGQLIHQLVLHRTFRAVTGWPVEPSEAWSRLGYAGNRWREFCNHLLHPDPLARPGNLDAALKEVQRVARRPMAFTVVRYAAVAAVVAALAGGSWYYAQHHKINAEVQALKEEWDGWYFQFQDFDALKKALNPAPESAGAPVVRQDVEDLKKALDGEPALRAQLASALKEAEESTRWLTLRSDLINVVPGVFDASHREKVRRSLGSVRRLQDVLRGWEFRRWLATREAKLRERDWSAAADYLHKRLAETEPVRPNSLATALTVLLKDKERIRSALAGCDEAWTSIRENCAKITQRTAPAPPGGAGVATPHFPLRFVQEAMNAGRGRTVGDVTGLEEFLAQLRQWQTRSRAFADVLPEQWQDSVSLPDVTAGEKELPPEQYDKWLELLAKYRYQTLSAERLGPLRQSLKDSDEKLAKVERVAGTPEEQKRLRELKIMRANLEEGLGKSAGLRLAGDEAVKRQLKELDGWIKTYRDQLDTEFARGRETADVWSRAAVARFDDAESPVIRDAWKRQFATLAGPDPASLTGTAYLDAREKVDRWAAALRKVPSMFPRPADAPDTPFGAAMVEGWEKALRDAADAWAQTEGAERDARLSDVQQKYEAWLRETRSIADRYRAARGLLDSGASLDTQAADGQTLEQLADHLRKAPAPANEAAKTAITTLVQEVDRLIKDEAAITALREQVDQYIKKDELVKARELCDKILNLRSTDRDARQRKDDIAARMAQRTADMLAQAGKLLDAERFDAAEAVLDDAGALAPGHPQLAPLRAKIAEARDRARRRQGGEAIEAAKRLVERGRPKDALQALAEVKSPETDPLDKEIRQLITAAPAAARQADQWFEAGKFAPALRDYQEGLRGGNPHAMYRAAYIFRARLAGLSAPGEYVAGLVQRAAELNDPEALHELAAGGDANAVGRLQKLVEAGDPAAQSLWGQMLENGTGPSQNPSMAVRQYLNAVGAQRVDSAARRQVAEAAYRLAWLSENGGPLPQAPGRAQSFYRQAAEMGHAKARERLEQIAAASRAQTGGRGGRGQNPSKGHDLGREFQQQ
jgi:TPR repeat protein